MGVENRNIKPDDFQAKWITHQIDEDCIQFMEDFGFPIAPLVIGLILGPMAEENLRRALLIHDGSWTPFLTRPLSLMFVVLIVATVGLRGRGAGRKRSARS